MNPQPQNQRYIEHIETQKQRFEQLLDQTRYDAVTISSGDSLRYLFDDQEIDFHANPHFVHWIPLNSPDHLLTISSSKAVHLRVCQPQSYWNDPISFDKTLLPADMKVSLFENTELLWADFKKMKNHAYIGQDNAAARNRGFDINPATIIARLNWLRAQKTPYEIECIRRANEIAARGHLSAREEFANNGSEFDIHLAYIQSVQECDAQLPYPSIVALDQKSAILHYRGKNTSKNHKNCLIDAGFKHSGYCSDISRTYVKDDGGSSTWVSLLRGIEKAQQEICDTVKPGSSLLELKDDFLKILAQMLLDLEICRGLSTTALIENEVPQIFMPHGLGHMLGIQVHDVGGRQINSLGDEATLQRTAQNQRATRPLRKNEVITIEPGFYFIPQLLDPQRSSQPLSKHFNWALIDELSPFGGIRIEDNLVVEEDGATNLTRPYLQNNYLI